MVKAPAFALSMLQRVKAGPRSGPVALIALTLVALVIMLLHRPDQQPILWDRAYFVYMGQGILRGDPVYETTTLGYPPFTFLLSAGLMRFAGSHLNLATYLAPRLLSAPLAALTVGLLYIVTVKATRSAWAGLFASFTLLGFGVNNVLGASNLEPKSIVQFLALLAIFGLVNRRWWLVGLASGLAGTTWQPALILALVSFTICLIASRKEGWRPLISLAVGFVLGLLPSLFYLLVTQQLDDFVRQAIAFKLLIRPDIVKAGPSKPLQLLLAIALTIGIHGGLLLSLALFGIVAYMTRLRRQGWKEASSLLFAPSGGGILLLSILWLLYLLFSGLAGIEYLGAYDAVPVMFLVAWWSAWGCLELCARAGNSIRWQARLPHTHLGTATTLMIILTLCTMGHSLARSLLYRVKYTLTEEIATVQTIQAMAGPDASLLAINAEEFYVLTERQSPWRITRIDRYFLQFIEQSDSSNCHDLVTDIEQNGYQLVVIKRRLADDDDCLEGIQAHLQANYEQMTFPMGEAGCGTLGLLRDFVKNPRNTLSTLNLKSQLRCVAKLNFLRSGQLNSGTYYVFTTGWPKRDH